MMTEEKKRQIADALTRRVGNIVCPICHQSKYTLLDGYFVDVIQNRFQDLQLGGRILPSFMLVCNNCGHLENFSLGVLGLMEIENNQDGKDVNKTELVKEEL